MVLRMMQVKDFMTTNFHDVLYLGSQSTSRRKLLDAACIPYKILTHASQECVAVPTDNFDDYVFAIACDKMQHLQLPSFEEVDKDYTGLVRSHQINLLNPVRPELVEGLFERVQQDYIFVLTADTLVKAINTGQIIGKPENLEHAKEIVNLIRMQPLQITTGCCLKLFQRHETAWHEKDSKIWVTGAQVEFCVPEQDLDLYFKKLPGVVHASGASIIDDFGQCFLKSINGSHSAVIGLPLFELRQNLRLMGFGFYWT
jgi:septum formation protein